MKQIYQVFLILFIVLCSTKVFGWENSQGIENKEPPKIGHNKYKTIKIDLYQGMIEESLPFDIPFILTGNVKPEIEKIELFFIDYNSKHIIFNDGEEIKDRKDRKELCKRFRKLLTPSERKNSDFILGNNINFCNSTISQTFHSNQKSNRNLSLERRYYHDKSWNILEWKKPSKLLKTNQNDSSFHFQMPPLRANSDYKFYFKVYYSVSPRFDTINKLMVANNFGIISTQINSKTQNQLIKGKEINEKLFVKGSIIKDFNEKFNQFHKNNNPNSDFLDQIKSQWGLENVKSTDLIEFGNDRKKLKDIGFKNLIAQEIKLTLKTEISEDIPIVTILDSLDKDPSFYEHNAKIEDLVSQINQKIRSIKYLTKDREKYTQWNELMEAVLEHCPDNKKFIDPFRHEGPTSEKSLLGELNNESAEFNIDWSTAIIENKIHELQKNIIVNQNGLLSIEKKLRENNGSKKEFNEHLVYLNKLVSDLKDIGAYYSDIKVLKSSLDQKMKEFKRYWNWSYQGSLKKSNRIIQSTTNDFLTRAEYYISADLGMVVTLQYGSRAYVNPYLGVNFNLSPINRQVKYGLLKQSPYRNENFFKKAYKNLSVNFGVMPQVYHNENNRLKGTWSNSSTGVVLMTGIGLRFTDYLRFVCGSAWYKEQRTDAFNNNSYKTKAALYFGLTLDWDIRKSLKSVGSLIFGDNIKNPTY